MSNATVITSVTHSSEFSVNSLPIDVAHRGPEYGNPVVLPPKAHYERFMKAIGIAEVGESGGDLQRPGFSDAFLDYLYVIGETVSVPAGVIDLLVQDVKVLKQLVEGFLDTWYPSIERANDLVAPLRIFQAHLAARQRAHRVAYREATWCLECWGQSFPDARPMLRDIWQYVSCVGEHKLRVYSAFSEECNQACNSLLNGNCFSDVPWLEHAWDCPWCKVAFLDLAACDMEGLKDDLLSIRDHTGGRPDGMAILSDYWSTMSGQCSVAWRILGYPEMDLRQVGDKLAQSDCGVCRGLAAVADLPFGLA